MDLMKRGQGTLEVLIGVPIVVIGLLVAFVILEPIIEVLFVVLDESNSQLIANPSVIILLVSLIGLIITAMAVVAIVQSFRQPRIPQGRFA